VLQQPEQGRRDCSGLSGETSFQIFPTDTYPNIIVNPVNEFTDSSRGVQPCTNSGTFYFIVKTQCLLAFPGLPIARVADEPTTIRVIVSGGRSVLGMGGRRLAAAGAAVVVLAAVLLTVGIVGGSPSSSAPTGGSSAPSSSPADAAGGGVDLLTKDIAFQQSRLKTVPGDWTAWASLAADYVQQARVTADPTYYPKADGALAMSLRIEPSGNFLALTVKATVAAARHDFAGALELSDESLTIDPYNSTAYGVRGDALDELGRYGEALTSFVKMDHLQPSVSSFSRLSYAYELRGQLAPARRELARGLADADSPADSAFCAYYLGELAWNSGDLAAAEKVYRQGVTLDADYVPPLEGIAKVEAARGQTAAAIRDYQEVVDRLPLPQYVIELGDYLASLGRHQDARVQYNLVRTEEKIFQSQGVNVDLELSLFEADHGDPAAALKSASAEYGRRHSTLVEDAFGWALHVNGQDRAALGHANAALRLGTKSATFYFHRGMIENALRMKTPAVRDLQEALALNPHFSPLLAPQAHDALTRLGAA
jgi:tetratricopeptide (TPR) repeat protein